MRYIARKLGFYAVAACAALAIDFFLPRLIPGDPVEIILSRMAQSGPTPPGEEKAITALLGLGHGSLISQFGQYLDGLAHFRFGTSVTDFPEPVLSLIAAALPWTLLLVGMATVLSFVLGTVLGAVAGWRRSRVVDALIPATTFLTSLPYFWLALLFLYAFAYVVKIFPLYGGYAPTVPPAWSLGFAVTAVEHSVLPALTIVVSSIGGWLLGMRNMTLTTLSDDYVVAAEAKGLSPRRILVRYAARNAVLPSLTGFAISLGFVVSGAIAMEYVFSYPGIGYLLLQAVQNDDYPLMQGIFLVIVFAVLGANLITDLVYGIVDPRTRQAVS
jgi:peptide/nickel transport system permease protein